MKHRFKPILKQAAVFAACFVSFLLIWIFAIPFVRLFYVSTARGLRWSLILVFSALLLVMGSVFTLWFVLLPVFALEASSLFGFMWLKGRRRITKIKLSVGVLSLLLVHMGLGYLLMHFASSAWEHETHVWVGKITDYIKTSSQSEDLMKRWEDFYNYIPAFYLASYAIAYFLCYWNTWSLNKIEIPSVFFWGILGSFSLTFINFEALGLRPLDPEWLMGAKNIFFVLCSLYFFQGVAVLNSFFERIKIARFWRNLWYILIILYLPIGLVFMGVAEFLFDYREKYKKKRKDI